MKNKLSNFKIGLRTIKTAAAVVISMAVVNIYGATTSKLTFAMLGAMAAMQPTFKESLESCLTQFLGVFFGALVSVLLILTPIPPMVAAGIGIIIVITSYNAARIDFSPSLACLIVVTLCTTPDIQPWDYALGRFWDTAIGLGVGMLINALIFPYDNSHRILDTAKSLEEELIYFLEDMFDGDEHLPNTEKAFDSIDNMKQQLEIFSNQKRLIHPRRYRQYSETYRLYEVKAHQIVAHMEVLCQMGTPGVLNEKNLKSLRSSGAVIPEKQPQSDAPHEPTEKDILTNYHVSALMTLRNELLRAVKKADTKIS